MRDKVKIAVLKFVYENPGVGLNVIIEALKKEGAKATITKKRNQLEIEGLLKVEKGERKGQKSKHYITETGHHLLQQTPKALSTARALLKIGFSQAFLNSLGHKEATRFLALMKDPEESKKIANLVAGQINLYAESISKPAWAVQYIKSLNRYFFVGSLPTEFSTSIQQVIEFNVFSDSQEAFALFFNLGLDVFKSMLRGGLRKTPNRVFVVCAAFRYDTEKGRYVTALREFKEKLLKTPPEKLKELWLKTL